MSFLGQITPRRVVITGVGCVSPLANNASDTFSKLVQGISGISVVTGLMKSSDDFGEFPCAIAGQVKDYQLSSQLLSEREAPRFDKFIHYALTATEEALSSAPLTESEKDTTGCILGVGMGGFPLIEATHAQFLAKGPRRISPFFIPGIIPNMAPGMVSLTFGLKGSNYSVSSACASSAHAMGIAATEVALGRLERVITGGSESVITSLPIGGFQVMKALSKQNHRPEAASRPFDLERDGFVMGEGAGILIFEDLVSALRRGAPIIAEVAAVASTSDAHHITAPHDEGLGAAECMRQCLQMAGITPKDVDYINAHGTSTPLGDIAETKAIKKVFGPHAKQLLISSTKSMTGHLLGAAGGIEALFSALAIQQGIVPPTINLINPDPECDLNYVPLNSVRKEIRYALSNSFGFGGTNCSILLKRFEN